MRQAPRNENAPASRGSASTREARLRLRFLPLFFAALGRVLGGLLSLRGLHRLLDGLGLQLLLGLLRPGRDSPCPLHRRSELLEASARAGADTGGLAHPLAQGVKLGPAHLADSGHVSLLREGG